MTEAAQPIERSLDPERWDETRALGHRMVDDLMDYLQSIRDRPAWRPLPPEARAAFKRPLPLEPEGAERSYEDFLAEVLPYNCGNVHPRFWGWVKGTGTPIGALAEFLTGAMNPNVWAGQQAATHVEAQVLAWCREMLGYPAESSGLLVSGGSMANLLGLAVAVHDRAPGDIAENGLQGCPGPLRIYVSDQTHNSIRRAAALLGLGRKAVRMVPTDAAQRIDLHALEAAITKDRVEGVLPIALVGNAGTVNTGAIDPLEALADLAHRQGLWFHIDGAFGALAAISSSLRPLVRGMERADSLAFDLHKWMYMPIDVGCLLVRDVEAHRRPFAAAASYLVRLERGLAADPINYSELGPELTRRFRALKVWMSLKTYGVRRYAEQVEQNVAQARYLEGLIAKDPALELLAPVPLNVVCFRYRRAGLSGEALDRVNREILMRLQEQGIAVP